MSQVLAGWKRFGGRRHAEQQMSDLAGQFRSADAQVKKLADATAERTPVLRLEKVSPAEERFNTVKEDLRCGGEEQTFCWCWWDVERLSVQVGERKRDCWSF